MWLPRGARNVIRKYGLGRATATGRALPGPGCARSIRGARTLGERALLAAQNNGLKRDELHVAHIMTPVSRLDTIDLAMVTRAVVGHVLATLKACGRQHAFVVDRDANGRQIVCGVFSATQIARQLDIMLPGGDTARTFAEIEAAIAGI